MKESLPWAEGLPKMDFLPDKTFMNEEQHPLLPWEISVAANDVLMQQPCRTLRGQARGQKQTIV